MIIKASAESEAGGMPGPSEVELRPILEIDDFGDAMTPELVEQETRLREQAAQR